VVVVNEKFGVRLTDIISPVDRVKQLGPDGYHALAYPENDPGPGRPVRISLFAGETGKTEGRFPAGVFPESGIRLLVTQAIGPQKYISLVEIGGDVLASELPKPRSRSFPRWRTRRSWRRSFLPVR